MTTTIIRRITTAMSLAAVLVAGATAARAQGMAGMQHAGHITVPPGASYTVADVEFMQGMIAHHAQAIYMSKLAAERGANPRVLRFANKVDQSQIAEITQMRWWLHRHDQVAPDTSSWRTMTMPGMLTAEQLKTLETSRGVEFDRAFLDLMIQHHEGALAMVKDLFASPRGGQEVDVSVFANDVVSVQTAEIGVMRQMLAQLPPKK